MSARKVRPGGRGARPPGRTGGAGKRPASAKGGGGGRKPPAKTSCPLAVPLVPVVALVLILRYLAARMRAAVGLWSP